MHSFDKTLIFTLFYRHDREQTALLRSQQDEAYRRSLEADQEKARLKQAQLDEIMRIEDQKRKLDELKIKQKEDILRLKEECKSRIPEVNMILHLKNKVFYRGLHPF